MSWQDIMAVIQTVIGVVSLFISLVTLNKVNQINQSNDNSNVQISKGKNNTQTIQK